MLNILCLNDCWDRHLFIVNIEKECNKYIILYLNFASFCYYQNVHLKKINVKNTFKNNKYIFQKKNYK